MHLLLIITDYGSFNNFLSELAIEMVQSGNKVDVICSNDKVINLADKVDYSTWGINIHFVSFPRGFNIYKQFRASVEIYNLTKLINPDLVHVHFTTGIFTTVLYKKLPFITLGTIHGLGYPIVKGIKKQIFKAVELFCFSRLDQIFVINKFDYNVIKGPAKQKTFLLESAGLGCDLKRFDIDIFRSKISTIKSELQLKEKDFVITFTGRFVHFKGFDLVVRTFLKINKAYPSTYKLILIGGNDPIHPTGLTESEEEEYMNCNEIIKVGFINNVERYLSVADVFLFPSLKEGMPVCIIEALAMGIPTITADSRGCSDLVENKRNGIVLANRPTVEDIFDAILLFKNSPDF